LVAAGDSVDFDSADWKKNPAGISQALQALFPDPIRVDAMMDAADDVVKASASSTIGRLVAEIVGDLKRDHQASIDASLAEVRETFDASGVRRSSALTSIDDAATAELGSIFPGIKIRLHIPVPTLEQILKGATVKTVELLDREEERNVRDLGHGVQRSIQIALIRVLSQRTRNLNKASNTILLIEEPELYLHPHAIELTRAALKSLARSGYQVIAVTHSPQFVGEDDIPSTTMLRRDPVRGTFGLKSICEEVKHQIAEHASQAEVLFSLTNSNQILFAESVVLFEGQTEHRLLPVLYELIAGASSMCHKVAMVSVQGSGSAKKAKEILQAIGVSTRAICDLDFACKTAVSQGLVPSAHPSLLQLKGSFSALCDDGLKLDEQGWPTSKGGSTMTASEAFARVASNPQNSEAILALHNELRALGFWVWRSGDFDRHLGISGKGVRAHAEFRERLLADWRGAVADVPGMESLVAWIRAS
jgi:hypothetical protein